MSLLVSDLATKIPSSLRIDSKALGGIVGRTTRTWPTNTQSYSPTSISQINATVPNIGYIDMQSVYFKGILKFTQGLRLTKSIHSIIRRIQVRIGSEIICDTDGYNVLQSSLNDVLLTATEGENSFAITQLTGSDKYREDIASGVQFCFIPNLAINRIAKLLPLHIISDINYTFWLDDTSVAFIKVDQSLTNTGYSIEDLNIVADVCTVSPEMENLYQSAYLNDRLSFPLTEWRLSPEQSDSPVDELKVETMNNSNRALVIVPRLVSRILNANVDSFQRTAQSLRYIQYQIGSNLLARYDCRNGAAMIMTEIQKTLDWSNNCTITPNNFHCAFKNLSAAEEALKSSKFLLVQNLELSRTDESILSGSARIPITYRVEYEDFITATSYYSYVLSDGLLMAGKTRGVQYLK